jgi:hypothetical protein
MKVQEEVQVSTNINWDQRDTPGNRDCQEIVQEHKQHVYTELRGFREESTYQLDSRDNVEDFALS